MSDLREMSTTTRHRLDTASQSSDEFLQQFPAPPVPQHFSDMNTTAAIDNHGGSQPLNEKTYPESNAPTLNNHPTMAANKGFVQKPHEHGNDGGNHAMPASAVQREPTSTPNAYALNSDFTFVDRPEKKVQHWTKRYCFFRWICCSMCFPPWVAYILWFIVIAVIICIIVIGAILGSFKMPTIDFAGLNSTLPNGTQQIEFSSTGVVIHAGLILNVINPNILSMKLSDLTAKAYYPINGSMVQIGKGYLDYQFIPKKSDINFTYPFQIDYNPSDPNSRYLLSSISDKCGFTGNTPSDIEISYDVSLNAQVLFVHVSPTISSSASFACPFQKGQVPGLGSSGGDGGLDGILGGLGAQVNETSSSTTTVHTTAAARATTALPLSLSTTVLHSSTVRPTFSSATPTTLLPTTAQSTHSSVSSVVPTLTSSVTSAPQPSAVSSSTSMILHAITTTIMSNAPLHTSTLVAPVTSSAAPTTASSSSVVPPPPTSAQPRVISSLAAAQPSSSSRTTLAMHTSSNPATSARPTTTSRSSTPRPTPTPEDDDDDDNGDDDDDDDDGDDDGDDDDGDDDGDDE
ncbi:hypothetical protein MBANPS3_000508 [Mucor bainieri]